MNTPKIIYEYDLTLFSQPIRARLNANLRTLNRYVSTWADQLSLPTAHIFRGMDGCCALRIFLPELMRLVFGRVFLARLLLILLGASAVFVDLEIILP